MPVPIPLNMPYKAIKVPRFLVKLDKNIPKIAMNPPVRIINFGFQPLYLNK